MWPVNNIDFSPDAGKSLRRGWLGLGDAGKGEWENDNKRKNQVSGNMVIWLQSLLLLSTVGDGQVGVLGHLGGGGSFLAKREDIRICR